jgi:hypothetical protein
MDDPMRGVDYGTKVEVYDLIREEARGGAPSCGIRPRRTSSTIATASMSSATAALSPTSA